MMYLNKSQIETCFPFFLATDSHGTIKDMGRSLLKILGSDSLEKNINNEFFFILPFIETNSSYDSLLDQTVIIQHKKMNFKLIGQVIKDEVNQKYIFTMCIQLNEIESFSKYNINFSDFAPQDQVFDFLLAFHTYKKAELDTSRLNTELKKQKNIAINASEMKSKFLANMSHELRTPLNGIIGIASVLKETNTDSVNTELIDIILSSGDHLLSLINDILDLSKIEAGESKITPQPMNIRKHLNELKSSLDVLARNRSNTLEFNIPAEVPENLVYDPVRIIQVLTNLLGNAIKFTKNGSVRLELSIIGKITDTAHIKFEIIDTGSGIPSLMIDKIFSPFMQLEQKEKNISGTGLGLSICKNLISAMGGEIKVTSKINIGSNFFFSLQLPVSE
jgi:signal transduction histidine kinase